jgi:hypothetical protein
MRISRRDFLSVAGAVATLVPLRSDGFRTSDPGPEFDVGCALIDLGDQCALRESLRGFQAALADKYHAASRTDLTSLGRCRFAVVPGVGMLDPPLAPALSGLLQSGTVLLLESGAGFLSAPKFAVHQAALHRYFDVAIDRPLDLWSDAVDDRPRGNRPRQPARNGRDECQRIPYVHYQWPTQTTVRDFSRAMPVSAGTGHVIGKIGDVPVAWKTRVGNGTLIVLGSPIGPSLGAGDSDARNWLHSVVAL